MNSPLFDVSGFRRHLKDFMGQMQMAAQGLLKLPDSKRGIPNSVDRVDLDQCRAPEGWHLSDAELCAAIDKGIQQCIDIWVKVLGCTEAIDMDITNSEHFFSNPVKHFPHGDIYATGVTSDDSWYAAQRGYLEDPECLGRYHDGDDAQSDDPAATASTLVDVEENSTLAEQFGEILRQQGVVEYPNASEDRIALFKAACKSLSIFNQGFF